MAIPISQYAQIAIWTKKFAYPLFRLYQTQLQKISASEKGEIILSVYKPSDDKSLAILSIKKGESGLSLSHHRPVTLKQPNSFVQIARKYLHNKRITAAYATFAPICVILEFSHPSAQDNEAESPPNCLILDLDAKPPRVILAKKTLAVPQRYQTEVGTHFKPGDSFFESWCEWSEENTKTKKRAAFAFPLLAYCPLIDRSTTQLSSNTPTFLQQNESHLKQAQNDQGNHQSDELNLSLAYLPTHIRRSARTKLQFLQRRLQRQKFDLPTEQELIRLKTQSENLKNILYLWPKDSLTWYIPPQFIEQYNLNAIYTLKKGEKPSAILNHLFHKIGVLERRKQELTKRIIESEHSLLFFEKLIIESATELRKEVNLYLTQIKKRPQDSDSEIKWEKKAFDFIISRKEIISLSQLCKYLEIEVIESEQAKKLKAQKQERLPYRHYIASTGEFIRVARSATDGDHMLKLMPSNHFWLHVLTGEGSHVWLEKKKGEKKASPIALKEAGILTVHHSKHSRAQTAEVQFATRADIEKKKNLPVGKVLVRKCETFLVRYDDDELRKITGDKNV